MNPEAEEEKRARITRLIEISMCENNVPGFQSKRLSQLIYEGKIALIFIKEGL